MDYFLCHRRMKSPGHYCVILVQRMILVQIMALRNRFRILANVSLVISMRKAQM